MTDTLANAAAAAAAKAVTDLIDAGAAHGNLLIYDNSGGVPATVDAAATGTLLATLAMSKPAFTTGGSPGVRDGAPITDAAAGASGTAAYFRCADSDGNPVIQGVAGTSGAALNLDSTSIGAGAAVSVSSLTYTQPK